MTRRVKVIEEFHLAGVTWGGKDIVHVPEWEQSLRGSFLRLLDNACTELYGEDWPLRLKMEEGNGSSDGVQAPVADRQQEQRQMQDLRGGAAIPVGPEGEDGGLEARDTTGAHGDPDAGAGNGED